MSFQLAEAYVELRRKGFTNITDGLSKIRGQLGSIVSFATGPLGVALAGIGAGAGIAGMVGMAASAEQTATQFRTLTGSAEAAKKIIAELQQFGATTPFEFPGLATAAKTLLAFGVAQDQIIPTMQVLGDIAAATGNSMEELSQIYGKARSRGALMTEQLDQFNERGIPVGAKLAEMLGKTGDEIRDMASKGQISFGDLQRAMVTMNSEGGIAFNGMKDQSTTLGGLWSTLKDNITVAMTSIGEAIVEGFDLKAVVANMTNLVAQFQSKWIPSIVNSFRWLGENIVSPVLNGISSIATAIYEFVIDFDLYWEYAYTSVGNSMNNIYQSISAGMVNSWRITKWFFSNFLTIAQNVIAHLPALMENSVMQIINNFESLIKYFATGEMKFDWSPMVDSFNLAVGELKLPGLVAPEQDALRTDLDRISKQLADRATAREAARFKAQQTAADEQQKDTGAQLKIEEGITKEKEKQKAASFVSLVDLADKMQQSILSGKTSTSSAVSALASAGGTAMQDSIGQTARVDSLQRQVTLLESLLSLAQGTGIRVAQDRGGGIALPNASVQFGAAPGA